MCLIHSNPSELSPVSSTSIIKAISLRPSPWRHLTPCLWTAKAKRCTTCCQRFILAQAPTAEVSVTTSGCLGRLRSTVGVRCGAGHR